MRKTGSDAVNNKRCQSGILQTTSASDTSEASRRCWTTRGVRQHALPQADVTEGNFLVMFKCGPSNTCATVPLSQRDGIHFVLWSNWVTEDQLAIRCCPVITCHHVHQVKDFSKILSELTLVLPNNIKTVKSRQSPASRWESDAGCCWRKLFQ